MTKKILLLTLFLLWSNPVGAVNWCLSAVACYPIETGSGTTITDQSANTNTGNFASSGHPAWDSGELPDSGDGFLSTSTYSLDYTPSDDVNIGSDASIDNLPSADLSVTAWINPNVDQSGRIVDKRPGSPGWYFQVIDASGASIDKALDFFLDTGGTDERTITVNNAIVNNVWQHIGVAHDFSALSAAIYVDGVLQSNNGTFTSAGTGSPNDDSAIDAFVGSQSLGSNNEFDGNLDEVALFSTLLDATDFSSIMQGLLDQGGAPAATFIPKVRIY